MNGLHRRSVWTWAASAALAALAVGSFACGSMAGGGAGSAVGEQHPLLGATAPSFELASPNGKQKVSLRARAP